MISIDKIMKTTTMQRTIISLSLLGFIAAEVRAQEGEYRYADAAQLWRTTDNAAGLWLDSTCNRGYAQFDLMHRDGNYRRVQEESQLNQLTFDTERYQRIGNFLTGYGSMRFDMNHAKDRSWSDVMRPYNSNPFIPGSNIGGKYDLQAFDLTAAIGSRPLWGVTTGLRLDYKVADLSRLRDPRSRSELLDYKLTPSLTYNTGSHTFGLDGSYSRRKEKIPNIQTVQNDPNIAYYLLSGMETATGSTGGYKGFGREWVEHRFAANLAYNYRNGQLNSLTTLGVERGSEDVLEDEKHEPGHFTSYNYHLASKNRVKDARVLHQIDLNMSYEQAYADEYKQQRVQTKDALTGLTSYHYETLIEYRKRYQIKLFEGSFAYRANFIHQQATTAYAGAKFALCSVQNRRLLPLSKMKYEHFDIKGEGGKSFFDGRLWVDAAISYHIAASADLSLADATTAFAQQVLTPDQDYYRANYMQGRLELKYLFPLTIKRVKSNWYIKAYGDYLRTHNHLERKTVGVSLGIYN